MNTNLKSCHNYFRSILTVNSFNFIIIYFMSNPYLYSCGKKYSNPINFQNKIYYYISYSLLLYSPLGCGFILQFWKCME